MGNAAKPGLIIFVMAIMGLILAAIEQIAYESSYILTLYISSASDLIGLQILTIIMFMLAGCIIAAMAR